MARHLVVISEDALVYEDLETLKTLPAFAEIWSQTARVNRVRSVYPTITYPCHTTMQTGVYPNRHGIINNEQPIMCEKSSKWIHFRRSIQAKTIFDYAKEAGLTTAASFWPVTGSDPSIDYLLAEYWPQTPEESSVHCYQDAGTTPDVMEKVVKPNLPLVENRHRVHPYCDEFVNACACAMIREYRPNLVMVHPANIDAYRHHTGLFGPGVTGGLYEAGLWFSDLIKATKDAGIYDDTDFVITSDHGQMSIVRTIAPNAIFAEHGLIDVDESGNITDYTAFVKSAALSAHVYLKNPEDKEAWKKTYDLLNWMCAQEVYGITRVYTREEVDREEHLSGGFSFAIESDGFSSFANDWTRPVVRSLDVSDYRFGRATHGHNPDKGPQPTMFMFGPHVRAGAVLERADLVDEAPTWARLLGLSMKDTDGHALEQLIKD